MLLATGRNCTSRTSATSPLPPRIYRHYLTAEVLNETGSWVAVRILLKRTR